MLGDNPDITYFGETDSRNRRVSFGIRTEDRSKHMYVIGKTGMGKSTLLENMAIQDITRGNGLAFLDPHGKTADLFLKYVPEHRIKDVIYFAPFDTDFPISFNVMEDVGADKRHLVANGLMSAFKKIWVDAWSARMEYILNNILLALLEYPDSTLVGVNRMLADKEYRNKVVANVTDSSVKAFWIDEFAKYGERYMQEAGAAIQNKIGQFISNPLVRNIIGQPKSTFDLRKVMDEKKIIIINLSKGRMGEANANLLGSMIITKIYLAAMSRADVPEHILETLPHFYLYVDEFQNFANESFADILSEARKYKLNLTVAHQYIEQMSEEVRAAVFGNVGSMVVFRVGAYDAEVLEKEFAPQFTIEDLVNLGRYQIYLKLMIDGVTSPPFSAATLPQIERPIISHDEEIIEYSRKCYARPRMIVEDEIRLWHSPMLPDNKQGLPGNSPRIKALPPKDPTTKKTLPTQRLEPTAPSNERRVPPQDNQRPQLKENFREAPKGNQRANLPQQRNNSQNNPSNNRRTDEREVELRKAISLDYLKKQPENAPKAAQPKNDKVQTPEHVAALKEALAQVMKENAAKETAKRDKEKTDPRPAEKTRMETPQQSREEKKENKPREVPEDVLRDMLKVED
jgi:hypothetical protein